MVGLWLGAMVGAFTMALMAVGRDDDEPWGDRRSFCDPPRPRGYQGGPVVGPLRPPAVGRQQVHPRRQDR